MHQALIPKINGVKVDRAQKSKKERDPNLDNSAVRLYRDVIHLTPNYIQRRDIAVTVIPNGQDEMSLWEAVLIQFMREGRNPRRVDWLLDRFEQALRTTKRRPPL